MKQKTFTLSVLSAFCWVAQPSFAVEAIETFQTRIVKYSPAADAQSATHFYLESEGRVARISADQSDLSVKMEAAYFNDEWVTISLKDRGDHDEIVALQTTAAPLSSALDVVDEEETVDPATATYLPSDLGSFENAQSIFGGLHRRFKRRSQCYQRAHVWAYSMHANSNIKSMKVFLFFTEKYVRAYNYKWWFHVAPFVKAAGVEYVMDRSYTSKPLDMQSWTNEFMKNKAVCPVIRSYSDYSRNEYAAYCFVAKVPMYYYNPVDLQALERRRVVIENWKTSHVNDSRRALK